MAEYSVDVPLWDTEGHLGNDPAVIADEAVRSSSGSTRRLDRGSLTAWAEGWRLALINANGPTPAHRAGGRA